MDLQARLRLLFLLLICKELVDTNVPATLGEIYLSRARRDGII
jgi:hypothetical protein